MAHFSVFRGHDDTTVTLGCLYDAGNQGNLVGGFGQKTGPFQITFNTKKLPYTGYKVWGW